MTDFETLKATLKEEILKELSSKTEGHELKATTKTRKTKKNEKDVEGATEEKPVKPKRKCTEKQLAALAAGRQKNPRWISKRMREAEERAKALEGQSPEEKKKQEE